VKGPAPRTFLGRDNSWASRVRVYRTADAVEVVHVSLLDLTMRRVFFDEVLLLTLHRARGSRATWLLIPLAAVPALLAALTRGTPGAFESFAALTLILATLAALVILVPTWTVSVYGKRARARMRYFGRPGRARTVYQDLAQRAAAVQRDTLEAPPEAAQAATPAAHHLEQS
jgi:hypothetical protein